MLRMSPPLFPPISPSPPDLLAPLGHEIQPATPAYSRQVCELLNLCGIPNLTIEQGLDDAPAVHPNTRNWGSLTLGDTAFIRQTIDWTYDPNLVEGPITLGRIGGFDRQACRALINYLVNRVGSGTLYFAGSFGHDHQLVLVVTQQHGQIRYYEPSFMQVLRGPASNLQPVPVRHFQESIIETVITSQHGRLKLPHFPDDALHPMLDDDIVLPL